MTLLSNIAAIRKRVRRHLPPKKAPLVEDDERPADPVPRVMK
ncbi:MAG TPA: hypothetical protein VE046_10295 [Steroidobacteraceae bacterium]|nr:hypothetical protein [Steroidobacteraceae bacterium]